MSPRAAQAAQRRNAEPPIGRDAGALLRRMLDICDLSSAFRLDSSERSEV
jgi:hypothetical protein